jgi:hypothetical protein
MVPSSGGPGQQETQSMLRLVRSGHAELAQLDGEVRQLDAQLAEASSEGLARLEPRRKAGTAEREWRRAQLREVDAHLDERDPPVLARPESPSNSTRIIHQRQMACPDPKRIRCQIACRPRRRALCSLLSRPAHEMAAKTRGAGCDRQGGE